MQAAVFHFNALEIFSPDFFQILLAYYLLYNRAISLSASFLQILSSYGTNLAISSTRRILLTTLVVLNPAVVS